MTTFICKHCGWEGERKKLKRGSKMVEMLIWSILVLPGPLYSIWRRIGRSNQCPHCQLPALAKLNSDEGWLARRKFDVELGIITPTDETKETDKEDLKTFGNDRPADTPSRKKAVDPDAW